MNEYIRTVIMPRLETLRSRIVRIVEPRLHTHQLYSAAKRGLEASGEERITAAASVDQYYTVAFIKEELQKISGKVLEVVMENQTSQPSSVAVSPTSIRSLLPESAVSIETVSVECLRTFPERAYDAIILDHTLNRVFDYAGVLRDIRRVTKDSGIVLAMLSTMAPGTQGNLWGFSPAAAQYMFETAFPGMTLSVKSYGNVFSGRLLLENRKVTGATKATINFSDPYFPVLTGVKVTK